jgi:hypothetical protein
MYKRKVNACLRIRFKNEVLRKIFGTKRDALGGE